MSVYITTKEDDDEVDDENERVTDSDQPLGLSANQSLLEVSLSVTV